MLLTADAPQEIGLSEYLPVTDVVTIIQCGWRSRLLYQACINRCQNWWSGMETMMKQSDL